MITTPDIQVVAQIGEYFKQVPFNVTQHDLYDASTLYKDYDSNRPESFANCYDQLIYRHFLATGKKADTQLESLARSLHDFEVTQAMNRFLADYEPKRIVAVMGGHGLLRNEPMYKEIALLSKELTERGSLMVSGGGPGAMEATHLGAWLAGRTDEEVEQALYTLTLTPDFKNEGWLEAAFTVMEKYPQKEYKSLSIPTWLYGHEPSTPFATHIAKLFENSIREDTLLTISCGGVIFTPGSAGTLQEIFQETVQNHYMSFGISSPMVFLGRKFWDEEVPIYPFMEEMVEKGRYKNLRLTLTDSSQEAIQELLAFKNEE